MFGQLQIQNFIMNYVSQLAQKFGIQLIKARRYNYSEQLLEHFFIDNPQLSYSFNKHPNKRNELLEILLTGKGSSKSKTCIVYAHGLGSNKLQVLPILKYYKDQPYDVCSFDFSGSGKSQGKLTSYGLREQDDVNAVLTWLDSTKSYDNYILWGRSMGSVAIILSQGLILNSKVQAIVLDSPFSSFQKICLEIASKKSYIPELILGPLIGYLKEYFSEKAEINPFSMNIMDRIKQIQRHVMFIYSKGDSVVSYFHSVNLKLNCRKTVSEIQIVEDHNMQRSKETFHKIQGFIKRQTQEDCLKTYDNKSLILEPYSNREKGSGSLAGRQRGLSLISKENKSAKSKQLNSKPRKSSTNSAKLNLSICQTAPNKHRGSIGSIKPKIACQSDVKQSTCRQIRTLKHPLSLVSLNSENSMNYRNTDNFHNSQWDSKLNMTQKLPDHKAMKLDSFYSAQFMNQNLNSLCSINSICLNKRKFREKDSTVRGTKQNIRPSIQLRRKNRFLL